MDTVLKTPIMIYCWNFKTSDLGKSNTTKESKILMIIWFKNLATKIRLETKLMPQIN